MDPLASINPYVSLKGNTQLGDVYQKLPPGSTRFLRYKGVQQSPNSPEQLLVFEFETHEISSVKSQYSALSYTWGHPIINDFKDDMSHAVICDGRRMPIGLNLNDALQHIYVESDISPTLLWVDAICINQSDLAERASQVTLMTSIYSNTSNVVVWLGKDDDDAREAHAMLSEYTPALQAIMEDIVLDNPNIPVIAGMFNVYDDKDVHERYNITQKPMDSWKALVRFLSRRWFSRIWIVQEMVFNPSHLICSGPLRFDWADLDCFVSLVFGAQWHGLNFHGLEKETSQIARIFTFHREIRISGSDFANQDPRAALLSTEEKVYDYAQSYLLSSAFLEATDPRDRVYALSAFVFSYGAKLNVKPLWLKADYTLQTTEAMLRTAQVLLWKTRSLDMLSHVPDLSDRQQSDLPSWMPHFHVPGAVASVETLLEMHQGQKYHAGRLSSTSLAHSDIYLHLDSPGNELSTQGYLLDTVEEVIHFDSGFLSTLEVCTKLPVRYANGQSPVEVLWRTLIGGRTDTEFPAPEETAVDFAKFAKAGLIGIALQALGVTDRDTLMRLISILNDIGTQCPHPSIPTVDEFTEILGNVMGDMDGTVRMLTELHTSSSYRTMISPTHWGRKGKAVIRTSKGYLGLSPHSTEAGDEVWLFKGANLFHVLRKADDGPRNKVLLGEGYVHGFMEGEALGLDGMSYSPVTIK
ncbi:HET-domain-containing protein [Annulohypoxylon maeteangense]|uniref:HET-domain-containing protein n=1 Tax=Annulohypoxylon maeteangense TaxID=1927788 RepID=UPI0020075E51|nr:HET-domain-containing protein [Annulohypoxylon maeteangense]KAI0886373.1 HET-domain-containing protein [Annulohypoxylon maeteangense]